MRHLSSIVRRQHTFIGLAILLVSHDGFAQQVTTLRGFVADKVSGKAVGEARISIPRLGRLVTADSSGHFFLAGLPAGVNRLVVRASGFPATQVEVELLRGAITNRRIELDSTTEGRQAAAQSLPTVSVTADATPANYRLVDFERRRQLGRGQFLTESEITKNGAYSVTDAIKNMRGVLYECGGGGGCYIRMARAPMRCLPEYIVDDQVMNDFGPDTPIRDVIGLEVYSGPTEVPGEYAGRYAGCGVVVIWTRSGPEKKRPKQ
jgi:Carboxypeptidase regulatory-like domain